MKTFKTLFIKISFLGLAFQGCGGAVKPKKTHPTTTIGSAVSLTAEEERANTRDQEIAIMLKTRIDEINQQEATSFSKMINYCDISGLKDLENSGTMEKIVATTHYESCENDNNMQNGDTIMTYEQTDEDGKFPEFLTLVAQDDYNFNKITLKKDASVECNINYNEDQSVESMVVLISGTVEYNSQTYTLNNHQEVIRF